ncbi:MAG: CPBP family glutamic-type intramembrane protease [Mucilaginibacter sp.]
MKNYYPGIFAGFVILFALYHAAEYMIVFQNSIGGFFGFQLLFFIAAHIIAGKQGGKGLNSWGLNLRPFPLKPILKGILTGIALYAVTWLINLAIGSEEIVSIPSFKTLLIAASPFVFGVIFSSLSEDILTRGYLYFHLKQKLSRPLFILLSATIFLLNHIYKLDKGLEAWLYLFLLGILLVIPLLTTKQLWFTTAMHWAGNAFFYISHGMVKTVSAPGGIPANYVFCLVIILFIGLSAWLLRLFPSEVKD